MSFDTTLFVRDTQGSLVVLTADVDQRLRTTGDNTITSSSTSFETKQVSGFSDSVFITGSADSHMVYQGRTTNPTAVVDGADVRPSADDLGRTLVTPYQVRDLVSTGYASLTNSQEVTVLSAVAGSYLDVLKITASNTSTVAVPITIRSSTAGGVEETLVIPIGNTVNVQYPTPLLQAHTGNNWTAQVATADQSDSPVAVSMVAIRNV